MQRPELMQPCFSVAHRSNPDVLNIIALLDEPDGVLDAPAGKISLNHPPQNLSIAARGFGDEPH